ncbi:DUF1830 domain-containing protein [Leptothermofonsia sichuanensis E412]|uniref:DUF1830 domain-containing protein n=1 Tax=Leptothermofonsia sichuanensis TaxID=2917832 RepID=UPI001CA6688F|nr:DUF1830 domain-containing protein [Leptothermofonsia sichuanensis]QZZ21466.1 DUF1830 domain-containing protein [Leptothermofonsia sichuanensis E412]
MTQTLDSLPSDFSRAVLCCYVNSSSRIQIVRITDVASWYFERVVFPGQRLLFEAPTEAHLEIHSNAIASAILADTIPCQRLQVQEQAQDPMEGVKS